ncbi:YcjF family protein [Magnetococcales bacterium HHB-1]
MTQEKNTKATDAADSENIESSETASESSRLHVYATSTIKSYTIGSMAVGIVPFPLIDLAVLTGVQLKMLHRLAQIYDVEFKTNLGKSAISSLVGSAMPVASAAPLAASLSKFIPIIGHTISYASLVVLNGASTYALGKVFQQHFASGGTFLTFDAEKVRSYFAEQFEKGKQVASNLRGEQEAKNTSTPTPESA